MINSKREMRAPGDVKNVWIHFSFKNYTKKNCYCVYNRNQIIKQHKIIQILLHSEYISTLNYKS